MEAKEAGFMKIAVLDGYTLGYGEEVWKELTRYGELAMAEFGDDTPEQEVIDFIGEAAIVLTNKVPVTGNIMKACPKLLMVQVLATGYNVVDTETAKALGIAVCNVPSYSTMSVCQHTIGLLLEICLRIGHHDRTVHEGKWTSSGKFSYWDYELTELDGKTLGIIGFGTIGCAVAKAAAALGMKILACSPHPKTGFEGLVEFTDLDTLLTASDVITLHCKLTPETTGLICRETIAKMKDGAVLINTSRGQVLNEADVAEALCSGKIRAAGVDVLSSEPPAEDNPLLAAPNCIITPHNAWTTVEARRRLLDITFDNIAKFLDGMPVNVVNGL